MAQEYQAINNRDCRYCVYSGFKSLCAFLFLVVCALGVSHGLFKLGQYYSIYLCSFVLSPKSVGLDDRSENAAQYDPETRLRIQKELWMRIEKIQ